MAALTDVAIKNLKPDGTRREIADAGCKGLYLFVLPSGTRAWYARYRNAASKQCRLPLGTYPDVGLAAAREKADAVRAAVRDGRDPVAERIAARDLAAQEAERLARGEVVKPSDSFEVVWAAFDSEHMKPTFRKGTAVMWRRVYKRTLAPRWAKRPINEITSADVYGVQRALQDTPAAADTALTICKAFFNWCIAAPRHLLATSPCAGIAKVKRPKEETAEDDRTLSDAEIRWLWIASGKVTLAFGGIVRLLLLTGARRTEVAQLVESELDTNARLWKLPAARAKNGRAHAIRLSDAALALLNSNPRVNNEAGYIFCTNGTTAVSGYSKFKTALDKKMAEVATAERHEPVTIPPWRLHSLRKTFATGLAKLGVSLQVAERCLNHSSGTLGGLAGIYNKHEYAEEQAAAFDAWGRYVESIVNGKPGNVVSITAARAK
jgi:integrase